MTLRRTLYLLIFIFSFLIIAYTLYAEFYDALSPCPLCILQRICMMALALIFLIAFIVNPKKRYARILYAFIMTIVSLAGLLIAGRQVYIQLLPPDQSTSCGVGLNYLLETLPLSEVIKRVFQGTADCAQIDWTFLNLSLAAWSMISFALIFIVSLGLLIKNKSR